MYPGPAKIIHKQETPAGTCTRHIAHSVTCPRGIPVLAGGYPNPGQGVPKSLLGEPQFWLKESTPILTGGTPVLEGAPLSLVPPEGTWDQRLGYILGRDMGPETVVPPRKDLGPESARIWERDCEPDWSTPPPKWWTSRKHYLPSSFGCRR